MMGFYDMIFGQSDSADSLLKLLNLSREDFYRYRDCYLSEGKEIAVYTRGGGGNRECWDCEEEDGNHASDCVITIQEKNRAHPLYLRDEDDDFDNTYATFYFKAPDTLPEGIPAEIARNDAWQDVISALKKD